MSGSVERAGLFAGGWSEVPGAAEEHVTGTFPESAAALAPRQILVPGRNCMAVPLARRAAVLVDGADYFLRLRQVLERATRSVLIVGWDFDADIRLQPDEAGSPKLGDFLRSLVETRPELEIRILIWNLSTAYAPSALAPILWGSPWQEHPRIHLELDSRHPLYAAQHQKLVCVDGVLAFVGGIDLTVDRWDTPEHRPHELLRRKPDGKPYGPVHDVQMLVEGEVALRVMQVALERWRTETGETVPISPAEADIWPDGLTPDFTDVPVGIARTVPGWGGAEAVHEVAALNRDALASARRAIYIEAQYLADPEVAKVLAAHLENPLGPEIVALATWATHGMVEGWIMGGNRDRIIRRLRRADRFDRFRIYYPVIEDESDPCEILVHSKLLIVDDRFLRIGSSNLNRRSMGLDLECDLAIESTGPAVSAAITRVRDRLLAEHLGTTAETLAEAVSAEGSLLRAVERLNTGRRRLKPYDNVSLRGSTRLIPGTRLFDPSGPFSAGGGLRALWKMLKPGG